MTIREYSWSFVLNVFLSIRVLELDAEFDGQAVVGVVLLVTAFVVPDGGLLLSYNSEISTARSVLCML